MKKPNPNNYDMHNHSHLFIGHKMEYRRWLRKQTKKFIIYLLTLLIAFFLGTLACNAQTKYDVYNYIKQTCQHPDIVYKQALKETGHLKCTKCSLRYNNLFGFWNGERYLKFDTWKDSVDFYQRWQIRKGYKDGQDYYEFLIREWGAPNMRDRYIKTLKQIKI